MELFYIFAILIFKRIQTTLNWLFIILSNDFFFTKKSFKRLSLVFTMIFKQHTVKFRAHLRFFKSIYSNHFGSNWITIRWNNNDFMSFTYFNPNYIFFTQLLIYFHIFFDETYSFTNKKLKTLSWSGSCLRAKGCWSTKLC